MKSKYPFMQFLILLALLVAVVGGYSLGRLFPGSAITSLPGIPPLARLDLPSQTVDGITAMVESYYADAARLVFTVRVAGESKVYFLDRISIRKNSNQEINVGYGLNSPGDDPSVFLIYFSTETPLEDEQLKGDLSFTVISPEDENLSAEFQFNFDIPVHPALTFNPKTSISANGVEILLDRIVITPAFTQIYLCYIKPTDADWMIGSGTELKIDYQKIGLNTYTLLFDSTYGDTGKGGEAGWVAPIQNGRCVKIGFPIGSANPESLTLIIPALEQSMPEVIPADELTAAYAMLKPQGIDMEWHIIDHGAYPEWKKLPAGMTELEAFHKFNEALGYFHYGPWVFDLQLNLQEGTQPQFSTSSYGAATPIPLPSSEPKIIVDVSGIIHSFDVSPDGQTIAIATSQGIFLYDLKSHKNIHTLNEGENGFTVAWSQDGENLAVGSVKAKFGEGGAPHLTVWKPSTWKIKFEPEFDTDPVLQFGAIAWSPDGRFLATGAYDRGVLVFDIKTGEVISQQKDFIINPYDISWSPDGSRLIAAGDLGYGFRRWRVDNDESIRLYDQRVDAAIQLAWSPNGERIASGHTTGGVCIWTAATNLCDGFINAHLNAVFSLAWSPDGNQLATGGGVIRVWDTSTGNLVVAFGENDGSIYTNILWLAPETLVSLETGYAGEASTIVRFWDVSTGSVLMEFHGEPSTFGN